MQIQSLVSECFFYKLRSQGLQLFCYHTDLQSLFDLLCNLLRNLSRNGVVALDLGEIVELGDNVRMKEAFVRTE